MTGLFAVARDVTDNPEDAQTEGSVEHRLNEFDAVKADFVSRVSHELRSPLTSVLGYLELLEEGEAGPLNDEQRRMLRVMDRNAQRLLWLVEDLLTVARVDAGAFRIETSRVPFPGIVDRVMQFLAPSIESRALTCTVAVEPGMELEIDPEQLKRMLANLVSNSIKFTPPSGQIGITARSDAGQAVITVWDTGIGIAVDEQPQLFTRFFRSTAAEMFETQGAGLGLFIVKQIVEAHGGVVEASSTPGEGTTITVRLPLPHP